MFKFIDDISTQAGEFSDVLAWADYKNFVHEVNNEALEEILLDSSVPGLTEQPLRRASLKGEKSAKK